MLVVAVGPVSTHPAPHVVVVMVALAPTVAGVV